jgi:hypothetical protein
MTPEVADELVMLWREGLSQAAIANRQAVTESLIAERIKLLRSRGVDLSARRAPPRWSQETILEAMRAWAEEHGRLPNTRDWKRASADRPSVVTLWHHFREQGGWAGAIRAASERDESL